MAEASSQEEGKTSLQVPKEKMNSSVVEAINHLGINLYKLLAKENTNVFFSPFAISTVLAMLLCGSEGETAEEMREVLGYDVSNIMDEESKPFFQKKLKGLGSNPGSYTLHCANAVLSNKEFSLNEEYKSFLEVDFKAFIKEVDFRNEAEEAVKSVNEWVKNKTNNMIPEVLNSLDPSTMMIILNAVYFKGIWLEPFDVDRTFPLYFCNQGDKEEFKHVDMMHSRAIFRSMANKSYQALLLPYRGCNLSMLILLPNSKDGLSELENSLSSTFIHNIEQRVGYGMINVALPKFKLESSTSLKEAFQSLGLNRVFNRGATLNGISDSDELFIYDVSHKATLEVNEKGTEDSSLPSPIYLRMKEKKPFIADHPFMFAIYNTENNLILFMGRVNTL